jgi:hypothetical protein
MAKLIMNHPTYDSFNKCRGTGHSPYERGLLPRRNCNRGGDTMTHIQALMTILLMLIALTLPVSADMIYSATQEGLAHTKMELYLALNDKKAKSAKTGKFREHTINGNSVQETGDDEPSFKIDPIASNKFKQTRDSRLLDTDSIHEQKSQELRSKGATHFISVITVVFTKNHNFLTSPASSVSYRNPEPIITIVRTDADEVMINTTYGHRYTKLYDLDRTDTDIHKALMSMEKSNSQNPAIVVINDDMINSEEKAERFDELLSEAIRRMANNLRNFDSQHGRVLIPNSVPNYLLGNGKSVPLRELFLSLKSPEIGTFSVLVVTGAQSKTRDYYDSDGRAKYYYINTRNSAPIELDICDLSKVSSVKDISQKGIFSRTLIMQNDIKITFGGLSIINPDFLKSDNTRWKGVLGLSSPNGFTIAIEYKDGKNIVHVSGEEVHKNTFHIQDKLPNSIVKMFKVTMPDSKLPGNVR